MKKFSFVIRVTYLVSFIVGIFFYAKAPSLIPLHFMDFNQPNEMAPALSIFFGPILCLIIGEVQIHFAKKKRGINKLEKLPALLPNEWNYFWKLALVVLLIIGIMPFQIR